MIESRHCPIYEEMRLEAMKRAPVRAFAVVLAGALAVVLRGCLQADGYAPGEYAAGAAEQHGLRQCGDRGDHGGTEADPTVDAGPAGQTQRILLDGARWF